MAFNFKNFTISDNNSALKVGVDAVLLASWVNYKNAKHVLDVGCGCGILTIAAGKKLNNGKIYGLDIDEGAIKDTIFNIQQNNLTSNCFAVNDNFLTWNAPIHFDTIICNPPYFKGLNTTINEQRQKARFEKFLPINDFFLKCNLLCSDKIYMVYPYEFLNYLIENANKNQWFINDLLNIKGNPSSEFKRCLIKLTKKNITPIINNLTIEIERGTFTKEYQQQTKEYYLKF